MQRSAELARRALRGPRYTSYPTASEFSAEVRHEQARNQLRRTGAEGRPVSAYIHVPFCPQLCWYCACNVKITRDRGRGSRYIDLVEHEIDLVAEALGARLPLSELTLGGGSPNFLAAADLERLTAKMRSAFDPSGDCEMGIELDPRQTTRSQVERLGEIGYRRLSVGVQDFDEDVQAAINRLQSFAETRDLITTARANGFSSVGVDLIYGLPGQTVASFARTLRAVIELEPDRVALFGYAHIPALRPHQKLVERSPIPEASMRSELFVAASDFFVASGYERIGFDHFALPQDPLSVAARTGSLRRNFQGFSVDRGSSLLAFGTTGISNTDAAYWQNESDIDRYAQALSRGELPVVRGCTLSDDDRVRRFAIEQLMCTGKLVLGDVEKAFAVHARDYFTDELDRLKDKELNGLVDVDVDVGSVTLTTLGQDLVRNVCMVFDSYAAGRARPSSTTI